MALAVLNEQEVRYRVSKVKELPATLNALQRLLGILHEDTSSQSELLSLIGYDQALSAKIFRVANSSYYGFRGKASTLSRAIAIIGLNQVRSICLCALLEAFLSKNKALNVSERERLWKHAFLTAKLAGVIAQRRPWISEEQAYVLGLLHDLGRYVMAVHFTEHYRAIMNVAREMKISPSHAESRYGLKHDLIGKWLSKRWALPEEFQSVMEFHHRPEQSPSFKAPVTLIALANVLANSREYPALLTDEFTCSCCRALLIVEEELEEYQVLSGEIWPEADNLWNLLSRQG